MFINRSPISLLLMTLLSISSEMQYILKCLTLIFHQTWILMMRYEQLSTRVMILVLTITFPFFGVPGPKHCAPHNSEPIDLYTTTSIIFIYFFIFSILTEFVTDNDMITNILHQNLQIYHPIPGPVNGGGG